MGKMKGFQDITQAPPLHHCEWKEMRQRLTDKRTHLYLTMSGNISTSPFVATGSSCPSAIVKRVCKPVEQRYVRLT